MGLWPVPSGVWTAETAILRGSCAGIRTAGTAILRGAEVLLGERIRRMGLWPVPSGVWTAGTAILRGTWVLLGERIRRIGLWPVPLEFGQLGRLSYGVKTVCLGWVCCLGEVIFCPLLFAFCLLPFAFCLLPFSCRGAPGRLLSLRHAARTA